MIKLPLEEHAFFRRLADLIAEVIRDTTAGDSGGDDPFRATRPERPEEVYLRAVFLAAAELMQLLQQMSYTPAFLASYRATPALKKLGVTRFEYLVYQLENWFIRCTALSDRALILANSVCQLGFRPQDCKLTLITTNAHVRGTDLHPALRALDKHVNAVRPVRNSIAHQRRLRPEGWDHLEGVAILAHIDPSAVPARFLKRLLDNAVVEQRTQISDYLSTAISLTGDLFSSLHPQFNANYARDAA
ncbi:MAG: Cthe_2314 family HEPN domain-containing protein [Gemmatimonadaceae bacterium]